MSGYRTHTVGAKADDRAVPPHLHRARRPGREASDNEARRGHVGQDTHGVITDGREPVKVGRHFVQPNHDPLQALCDIEHFLIARCLGKTPCNRPDHHIAWCWMV